MSKKSNSIKINYTQLNPEAKFSKSKLEAACYDIFLLNDYYIEHKSICVINSGLAFDIPEGYHMKLFIRSGVSTKQNIMLINSVGIIDSYYKQEVLYTIFNNSNQAKFLNKGERIVQFLIEKNVDVDFNLVDSQELNKEDPFKNGFGSSGK